MECAACCNCYWNNQCSDDCLCDDFTPIHEDICNEEFYIEILRENTEIYNSEFVEQYGEFYE